MHMEQRFSGLSLETRDEMTQIYTLSALKSCKWNLLDNEILFISCRESLVAKITTVALTFVIGELQIVVHGGDKLLHDKTPDNRRQVTFAPHLPFEDLDIVICPRVKTKKNQTTTHQSNARAHQQRANRELRADQLWRGRSLWSQWRPWVPQTQPHTLRRPSGSPAEPAPCPTPRYGSSLRYTPARHAQTMSVKHTQSRWSEGDIHVKIGISGYK